jgi:hypothetical protein
MRYQEITVDNPKQLNDGLYARFTALAGTDRLRQSHHFGGRFENTYIDAADIPEIAVLLDFVKQRAGRLLGVEPDSLKAGFWFNAMEAGHRTAPHHHDENDELLSAVYYIRVPEDSGDLVLHDEDGKTIVRPKAGKLVLFAPDVLHEVTVNQSNEMRLSVAFNVGPVDDDDT